MKNRHIVRRQALLSISTLLCAALLLLGCQESAIPVAPDADDPVSLGKKPGGTSENAWVDAVDAGLTFNSPTIVSTCSGKNYQGAGGPDHRAWWNRPDLGMGSNCLAIGMAGSSVVVDGETRMDVFYGKGKNKNKINSIQIKTERLVGPDTYEHYLTDEIFLDPPQTSSLPDWTMQVRADDVQVWRMAGSGPDMNWPPEPLWVEGTISVGDIVYTPQQ